MEDVFDASEVSLVADATAEEEEEASENYDEQTAAVPANPSVEESAADRAGTARLDQAVAAGTESAAAANVEANTEDATDEQSAASDQAVRATPRRSPHHRIRSNGRSLRLRIPPGARISIQSNHRGGGGRGVVRHHHHVVHAPPPLPGGNDSRFHVPVQGLEPRPLPDDQQRFREDQPAVDSDLERFRCPICFEFMDQPHGCGHCTGRFCKDCLQKHMRNRGNTPGLSSPSCPLCRKEMDGAHFDAALHAEMAAQAARIPCRYAGCGDTSLVLTAVRSHEGRCPEVRVACRYAAYGCAWKGRRGDVSEHEASSCPLAKIPGFVELHRSLRQNYVHEITTLRQHVIGLQGVVESQAGQIRGLMFRHSAHPFHVWQFIMTGWALTPHFLAAKSYWRNLYESPDGRARVFNTLATLPTAILGFKIFLFGYHFVVQSLSASRQFTEDEMSIVIDVALITTLCTLFCLLAACCFYLDAGTKIDWAFYKIPHVGERRWLLNVASISLFLFYFIIMDFYGSWFRWLLSWYWIVIGSVLFPSLLFGISVTATRDDAPSRLELARIPVTGRASGPFLFGLQFSFMVANIGFRPSLDALVFFSLAVEHTGKFIGSFPLVENVDRIIHGAVFSGTDVSLYWAYLAARGAVLLSQGDSVFHCLGLLFVGISLLLASSHFFALLFFSGSTIGVKICRAAKKELARRTREGIYQLYTNAGVIAFAAWICLLALICVT
jgi:hypothetical protein